ncbi:MAG: polysaccharide biosynthesis/export family protein [Bacteroidota bacterium]|nr:polysaccharide biosynthesis/export family protein [Bacteroidota bacterium]
MNRNILIGFATFLLIFASCTTQKQMVYLQNIDSAKAPDFFPNKQVDYQIQNQDILYVKVSTLNEEVSNVINNTSSSVSQQNLYQTDASLYVNGYSVDKEGDIEMPVLGKIKVSGLTLKQAKDSLQLRADKYLKDATVILKLLSFKVTVVGEANHPGVYKNYNNQLTVLEAVGMAGDVSDYGDRKKVLVLRPEKEGVRTYRIDLTSTDILKSPAFYLQPNDMVYIQPLKNKTFKNNMPSIQIFLTGITTLILVLNFIKK